MSQRVSLPAVITLTAMALSSTAAAACPPAAALSGDSNLVASVQALLFHQGIAAAVLDCPAVRGHLTRNKEAIVLTVEGPHGHKSTRQVANAEMAALIIETWTRDDLAEPLLQTFSLAPVLDKPEIGGEVAEVIEEIQLIPRVATSEDQDIQTAWQSGFSFGLLMTASGADDGTFWLGGMATGCVPLDALCVGGLIRVSVDTEEAGVTLRMETERSDVDAMATIEAPLRWSKVALVPGLGVGLQIFKSSIDSEETGGPPLVIEGSTLALGASLRAALAIGRHSLVELGLFAEFSPFANTGIFTGERFDIAGEPAFMLHAGLGFRYGAP